MRRRVLRGMRIALPDARSWGSPSMIALPLPSSTMTSTSSSSLTCSATSFPGGHANSVAFKSVLAIPHSGPVPELASRSMVPSTASESLRATLFTVARHPIDGGPPGGVDRAKRSSRRVLDESRLKTPPPPRKSITKAAAHGIRAAAETIKPTGLCNNHHGFELSWHLLRACPASAWSRKEKRASASLAAAAPPRSRGRRD